MYQALDRFFESTAVTMTPPPAYGPFHILFTVFGFALCAFVAWKLRHICEKKFNIILFCVGAVLALSEVFKQLFYYFALCNNSYCWGEFPFQLCSVPMYLCLIVPFLKPGKLRRSMYSFMVLYNLLGGAISFAEPSGLLHGYWFLTVHALIWHMSLVFIGLFICFSKRGGTEMWDYWSATATFVALCGIAFCLNFFVQNVLHEHMNMFFVGPGNSPIVVFSTFSEVLGWYWNTPIYIFALSLGAYIVFCIIYLCQHKRLPFGSKQKAAA